jgi:hypothetical protein
VNEVGGSIVPVRAVKIESTVRDLGASVDRVIEIRVNEEDIEVEGGIMLNGLCNLDKMVSTRLLRLKYST